MTPVDEYDSVNNHLEALRLEQEWFDNLTEPLMRKSPVPPSPPPPPPPPLEGEEADDYFGLATPADSDTGDEGGIFKFEMDD